MTENPETTALSISAKSLLTMPVALIFAGLVGVSHISWKASQVYHDLNSRLETNEQYKTDIAEAMSDMAQSVETLAATVNSNHLDHERRLMRVEVNN